MPLSDLKVKYSQKQLKYGPQGEGRKFITNHYEGHHKEPHNDFLYGFLCLIYDGITNIKDLKSKMRIFFISATKQVTIEESDVEEYLQKAKQKNLIKIVQNQNIELTDLGIKLVEASYYWNLHTSYWMRLLFSKTSVMLFSAFFLIILSTFKILIGIQLDSQGMLSEGIENLTDLVKIGIIGIIGLKYNKDKLASIIIILMMMFTGASLIWSSIESFFKQEIIKPNVEAYMIGFFSILVNTLLMYLKGIVGRNSGNLSLLSDSKDSELNMKLSIGVLIGLTFAIFEIYFVDTIVGLIIASLIFIEGIEILKELLKKEEDFDIGSINVYADNIYENRLTGYILGNIRRESINREQLIKNFSEGLRLGRMYYEGFADFFYKELGAETIHKHIDKLLKGKYIKIVNEELIMTKKGLHAFYQAKAKEFKQRSINIELTGHKIFKGLSCLIFIVLLILLIIFAPQINSLLA
jgi:hypothetical protein